MTTPRKIWPKQYAEIRAKFDNGVTREELAKEHNVSRRLIQGILHETGVTRQSKRAKPKRAKHEYSFEVAYSEAHKEELEHMYCVDCCTLREMAEQLGVAHGTVHRALKHIKLKLRTGYRFLLPTALYDKVIIDYLEMRSVRKVAEKYKVSNGVIYGIVKLWKKKVGYPSSFRIRRIPPHLYAEIKIKYKNGATRQELANEYNCSVPTIHKVIHS